VLPLTPVKKLWSWLIPESVILGAAVIALETSRLAESVRGLAQVYPYVVFALGIVLAVRFQRSRLVFALLVLALAEAALRQSPPGSAGRFLFQATALLVPLNLAVITLMSERGTFTKTGLLRLGILVIQVAAVLAILKFAPARGAAIISQPILPHGWFRWTPLEQFPLYAWLGSFALTGAAVLYNAAPTGRAFLWALVAAFLGLHSGKAGVEHTIYLATAGLILIVAVIEASYLMAYQDGLTGLPARRALTEALQRLSGQFTVAMVDVDHFKKLNDTWGHDVGDQVLKMVASRLAKAPGGGRAFRYGGEEFAVLFSGRTVEECLPDLDSLRQSIEDSKFTIRRRLRGRKRPAGAPKDQRSRIHIVVTVSIGAAQPNGRIKTPEQVVLAADQALYRAKDAGRNRVLS
jgi:diguanylate cyclase (GGDEF)-like protein